TFSKALAEIKFRDSAGYSTATRQPPRWVAVLNQLCSDRSCSTRISREGAFLVVHVSAISLVSSPSWAATASGRMRRKSGWFPEATQAHAGHAPQAMPLAGDSHNKPAAAAR